jgi:hypothetical protein
MGIEDAASALLLAKGAGEIEHPGGMLLDHLHRVRTTLRAWGARPELCLAGLCHAFYGTDGFPVALGRRAELVNAIGPETERLVYIYAACDRTRTYPTLTAPAGTFFDRFTHTPITISARERREFAELTVANELDVFHAARDKSGFTPLLDRFATWTPLLTAPARQAAHSARKELLP